MKYLPLIWAALWRRKLRTCFTLVSVVVAFFLFGMLQGINLGIADLYEVLNTERLRTAPRSSDRPMPLAHLQQIAAVPGVSAVTPLTALSGHWGDNANTIVLGADVNAWFEVLYNPYWTAPREALAAMQLTRNGILVGRSTAEDRMWNVGDHISLQTGDMQQRDGSTTWEFEIVGFFDIPRRPEWATNVFANYSYVNDARATGANMSMQFITRIGEPERYAEVAAAVDAVFANSSDQTMTLSEEDYIRTLMAQVGNISYLLNGVVGAVLFTLLFLTANTMTLSVRERIPELAALKTLGFTDLALMAMVLAEVFLLCLTAAGVGLGAAAATFPPLMKFMGGSVGFEGMRIPLIAYVLGTGIAALLALVSGLPPAWRAMRLNIVDGLANR